MNRKTLKRVAEIHRTTLYIPKQLWRKIRLLAFDEDKATNGLIVEALNAKYGEAVSQ